ncbi:MAG: MerR family transcriptional regulator [Alphaproteobacteria bacterium]|nr:MerR family transcriptional regulator [Alphaproteobacteria bacterium]
MITIRKLGSMFGLSRTALLYYDRIGLLPPSARSRAGYRLYDEAAVARLRQIRAYKNAGLGLAEIADLLQAPARPDLNIFRNRLAELEQQIGELRIQQRAILGLIRKGGGTGPSMAIERDAFVAILRASGMDEGDMQRWHVAFEDNAPEAHHSFLRWLGISEDEALNIRKGAKTQRPA